MTAICRHTVLPFSLNGVPASVQPRCLALPMAEVMEEHLIQTVIQLLGQKEAGYIKTSSSGIFRSAEASLMYRPCISQAAKGCAYMCCVI